MNTTKRSLVNALGTYLYIVLVAWVMSNGEKWFANMDGVMIGVAMLTLFTLSAAIVGGFILGKPFLLYTENKKKDAVILFHSTLAWLTVLAVLIFGYIAAR